jgi:hypothetical protein
MMAAVPKPVSRSPITSPDQTLFRSPGTEVMVITKSTTEHPAVAKRTMRLSDGDTHVEILSQKVVGRLVLVEHVGVDGAAGEGAAHEEAEEAVRQYVISKRVNWLLDSFKKPVDEENEGENKVRERRECVLTLPGTRPWACEPARAPRRQRRGGAPKSGSCERLGAHALQQRVFWSSFWE